jgi:hypothetical protein
MAKLTIEIDEIPNELGEIFYFALIDEIILHKSGPNFLGKLRSMDTLRTNDTLTNTNTRSAKLLFERKGTVYLKLDTTDGRTD